MKAEVLSIREAAEKLSRPPQWLRRHLLEQEKKTGHKLLERVGAGDRPRYRVHMGRLRAYCPTLFDVRDPIAQAIGGRFDAFRRELHELREAVESTDANLSALAENLRQLRAEVRSARR